MSSGNPFRRSIQPQTSTTTTSDIINLEERFPAIEQVLPIGSLARTKKVRITSPPHSPPHPSDPVPGDTPSTNRSTSYSLSTHEVPTDSTDGSPNNTQRSESLQEHGEGSEDEGLIQNTKANSEVTEPAADTVNMPLNPFRRSRAIVEPLTTRYSSQRDAEGSLGHELAEQAEIRATKAAMDVDSFKRLLMTGTTAPANTSGITIHPKTQSGLTVDSSSSTDASSVSRQSIFEPIQEPQPESPRSSYERSLSDDNEHASLMSEPRKPEKGKKPPPPKHRHGKLVSPRAPQTVSFSDFTPSFPLTNTPPALSPVAIPPPGRLARTQSDLNKPLPPPPLISTSPDSGPPAVTQGPTLGPPFEPIQSVSTQKKAPPPPPLARRHSQLKSPSSQPRSRSNSSLTTSSQQSDATQSNPSSIARSPSSASTTKPPPPPARRTGIGAKSDTSNAAPTTDTPPIAGLAHRTSLRSPPPAPPSRTPSTSQGNSPGAIQPITAPPLPPPPRRGSSKSSVDLTRPGLSISPAESRRASNDRRISNASASSWRRETIAEDDGGSSATAPKDEEAAIMAGLPGKLQPEDDILADMAALQREIDELRERQRRAS